MQFHTIYILFSTDYLFSFENIITRLFIYSCRDQVILSLSFWYLFTFCFFNVGFIYYTFCCFTQSNDKLYIWLTLSPICGCLNVYICYFVIFDIYNNITLLNPTDIYFMNYRLIIYMLSFSHLSLHFNRKLGTVVIVW